MIYDIPHIGAINLVNVIMVKPVKSYAYAPAPALPMTHFGIVMGGIEGDITVQTFKMAQGGVWQPTGLTDQQVIDIRARLLEAWAKSCP